jgi:carbon storage regulator
MLVLTRKKGEAVVLPDQGVVFTILEIHGSKVRVGIAAPQDVEIHRREVWMRLQRTAEPVGTAAGPLGRPSDADHD